MLFSILVCNCIVWTHSCKKMRLTAGLHLPSRTWPAFKKHWCQKVLNITTFIVNICKWGFKKRSFITVNKQRSIKISKIFVTLNKRFSFDFPFLFHMNNYRQNINLFYREILNSKLVNKTQKRKLQSFYVWFNFCFKFFIFLINYS